MGTSRFGFRFTFIASSALGVTVVAACVQPTDQLDGSRGYGDDGDPTTDDGSRGSQSSGSNVGTRSSGSDAKSLFTALEPALVAKCGGPSGGCHVSGTLPFLKGPDDYATIKGHPGIVVQTPLTSSILTKGAHTGPSLNDDADLEKRVIAWLNAEALSIQSVKLAAVGPVDVAMGSNDIDLSAASTATPGVHLKFDATLVGTTLQLTKVRVAAPAGMTIHMVHPLFTQSGSGKQQDPSDSFSNVDATIASGQEAPLGPGLVFFTGWKWATGDKFKIELYKLEPGRLVEAATALACKDPTAFGTTIKPLFQATPNCAAANCHGANGNGNGALNLANIADNAATCAAILNKLDKTTPANSLLFAKVVGATAHVGGKVGNGATFQTTITNAINTIF